MGFVRSVLRPMGIAVGLWSSAYLLGTCAVMTDYNAGHEDRLERYPPPPRQDIRSFRTRDARLVTIVGEIHVYNRSESERAGRIADRYRLIAHEGPSPFEDGIPAALDISWFVGYPAMSAYLLGSGRGFHPTLIQYAYRRYPERTFALETGEDSYRNRMSTGRQAANIGISLMSALTAPLEYLRGKDDAEEAWTHAPISSDGIGAVTRYASDLDSRNRTMARNLVRLLEEHHEGPVLCIVGRAHVDGLVHELEARMHLEKAKTPQF